MNTQQAHTPLLQMLVFLTLFSLSLDTIVTFARNEFSDMMETPFDPFNVDGGEDRKKEKEEKQEEIISVEILTRKTEFFKGQIILLFYLHICYSLPYTDVQTPPPRFT